MIFKRKTKPVDGKSAEQAAQHYLAAKGLKPITQNYRCRQGEVDLIMDDGGTLVFVEVRYRKSDAYGSPLETVTHSKQKKVIIAAQHYLSENKLSDIVPTRFDVLGICGQEFNWVKSAF